MSRSASFVSLLLISGILTARLAAQETLSVPPVSNSAANAPTAVSTEMSAATAKAELEKAVTDYTAAFNARNVDAMVSLWSAGGVYSTTQGTQIIGQDNLRQSLTEFFAGLEEGSRLELSGVQQELLSTNLARETGVAVLLRPEAPPEESIYTAYYIRDGGLWKLESVEESEVGRPHSNYEQLKPLEWMIGNWRIDSADASATVTYSTHWTMNQNFIVSNFTIVRDGQTEMSGVEIIGWDPAAESIRSWIFDSEGGFGVGMWSRNEDKWSSRLLFQTNAGEKASSINLVTPLDRDTYQFESVSRERGGELLPRVGPATVNRIIE